MHTGYAPETDRAAPIEDRAFAATVPAGAASVVLLDSRPLVRDCLALAIRAEWPAARLTATGWDRLDSLPDRQTVALCVVSLGSPGSGPLEKVRAALPAAALVILSDDDDYASVAQAASQGARGYFSTATDLPVLVQGLRLVLLGGTAMPIAVNKAQAPARRVATSVSRFSAELFTPKELEVLRSLATGRPNKLIAYELTICETTVKVHLRHIFRKLGTTNRTHAALLARELLEVDVSTAA
jgi:DNA-binding NarL/FixJ family response regulator